MHCAQTMGPGTPTFTPAAPRRQRQRILSNPPCLLHRVRHVLPPDRCHQLERGVHRDVVEHGGGRYDDGAPADPGPAVDTDSVAVGEVVMELEDEGVEREGGCGGATVRDGERAELDPVVVADGGFVVDPKLVHLGGR